MVEKLASAIAGSTISQNKILSDKILDILKDIHRQFCEMIDETLEDASEEEVRKEFKGFLEKALPKFEDIKADLARIKRRHNL